MISINGILPNYISGSISTTNQNDKNFVLGNSYAQYTQASYTQQDISSSVSVGNDIYDYYSYGANYYTNYSNIENQSTETDNQSLSDLQNQLLKVKNKIQEMQMQFFDIDVPVPPMQYDFINEYGVIDEASYNQAFDDYTESKKEYDKKMQDLNNRILELSREATILEEKIFAASFTQNISSAQSNAALLTTGNASMVEDVLLSELDKQKDSFYKALETEAEQAELLNQLYGELNDAEIPQVPLIEDYTDENGIVNEQEYNKEMEKYVQQRTEYNNVQTELNIHIQEAENKLRIAQNQIEKADNNSADIKRATETLLDIQEVINNAPDDEIKSELENCYNTLLDMAQQKSELANEVEASFQELWQTEIPAPAAYDYSILDESIADKDYENAYKEYQTAALEYERKQIDINENIRKCYEQAKILNLSKNSVLSEYKIISNYVTQLNDIKADIAEEKDSALSLQLQQQYDELKNKLFTEIEKDKEVYKLYSYIINMSFPYPPTKISFIDDNGDIDEQAYIDAVKKYDAQVEEYNKLQNELWKQING